MKIGIIDYGMGNLQSVSNALSYLNHESFITSDPGELMDADKIILPGVGAFRDAIARIKEVKLNDAIQEITGLGKPFLGICLGMQLIFDKSYEYGEHDGLKLLPGEIVPFQVDLKVPHMGWNRLDIRQESPLFVDLPGDPYVYFVHSYHLKTKEESIISATTHYGMDVQVAVQKDNVYALQFHPEKSGNIGLKILDNFAKL